MVSKFKSFKSRKESISASAAQDGVPSVMSFAINVIGYEVWGALAMVFKQWSWLVDEDQKEAFELALESLIPPNTSPALTKTGLSDEKATACEVMTPRFDILWHEYEDSTVRSILARTYQMPASPKNNSSAPVTDVRLEPTTLPSARRRQFIPLVFYSHHASAAPPRGLCNLLIDDHAIDTALSPMIDQILNRGSSLLLLPFGFAPSS